MPDSIRELISKNVLATLQGISTGAGYYNTIAPAAVQRFQQDGQITAMLPALIVSEGDEEIKLDGPLAGASSAITRVLKYGVLILASQSDADAVSRSGEEYMNTLRADVQKAMLSTWSRGGYAIDTNEVSNGQIDLVDGLADMHTLILFTVEYRHRRDDPAVAV